MSVVKINAITIPEGMGPQLEERFAGRAKMVEQFDGFEDFQLLRPVDGESRYFVYTRWASEEHFQAWMNSQDFERGHASGQADRNRPEDGGAPRPPVAPGAELLSFEVVEHVVKSA
jgi:heme-degrading monooxygenase HmoA